MIYLDISFQLSQTFVTTVKDPGTGGSPQPYPARFHPLLAPSNFPQPLMEAL